MKTKKQILEEMNASTAKYVVYGYDGVIVERQEAIEDIERMDDDMLGTWREADETELYFYRLNNDGNAVICWKNSGETVTRFEKTKHTVYPVNSELSAYYDHPSGIILSVQDAEYLGIEEE